MPRTNEQAVAYMRAYRARKKAEATDSIVPIEGEGVVERTVREACEGWPKAKEQPETVMIAIQLARVVDIGTAPNKVQAANQLTKILDTLRGGKTGGKLAQLREGSVRERDT